MASSTAHSTSIFILYIYFVATTPPRRYTHPCFFKRKNHFKYLKNGSLNRQYEKKMTLDKRFRQNHTKYLRFKAFRKN